MARDGRDRWALIGFAGSTLRTGLERLGAQLRTARLTPVAGAAAFALMLVSWVADVAVLAIAFLAAGHYALIVLRVRHPSVDRILVTDQLPPDVHR